MNKISWLLRRREIVVVSWIWVSVRWVFMLFFCFMGQKNTKCCFWLRNSSLQVKFEFGSENICFSTKLWLFSHKSKKIFFCKVDTCNGCMSCWNTTIFFALSLNKAYFSFMWGHLIRQQHQTDRNIEKRKKQTLLHPSVFWTFQVHRVAGQQGHAQTFGGAGH